MPELPGRNFKTELGYGDYLRFRDMVLEISGLYFPDKKKADLEAGLFKALAASPLGNGNGYNLDAYYNLLRDRSSAAGRTELSRLINTLTIGETHFFRDESQFNALAAQVLPALVERKRAMAAAIGPGIQPQLRLWSAGCASGEEAYSLAILLKELLPDIDNWHILILATDINHDSLTRAREAIYSDWSFRENRAKAMRSRYFTPEVKSGGPASSLRYRLQENIRRMVTFTNLNLIDDPYPSFQNNTASMDLIICRNVTIYFAEETTRQVVRRFYEALVEGGWLVVGHSEPSLVIYRAFEACTFPDTLLYRKTGQPAPWPNDWEWLDKSSPVQPTNGASQPPVSFSPPPPPKPEPVKPPAAPRPEPDPYDLAHSLLDSGKIEEAVAELERKLVTAPNFAPAHSLLGRAYANMARWPEARQWCQSALKLDSLQAEAYYVLALIDEHEGQWEPAIDRLKKAIYLDREAPLPHFNLGMLYRKTGQKAQAGRAFLNAARVLEKWSPAALVPDSGGATARQLLDLSRRLVKEMEGGG